MDRIWKKGENSQGLFQKLSLDQLGGEDHLLGSEEVNQVYLTEGHRHRASVQEAILLLPGKTVYRSQPWAHRGYTTVLHLWEESRVLLCFRDSSPPALRAALSTPEPRSSLWGKQGDIFHLANMDQQLTIGQALSLRPEVKKDTFFF